ncbi:hypothetical protein CULC0102_1108 [Corynebacterium ulcerans 0102]|nr:hypothetical protein CULC0102_1108 [Corynebacterium ulcerans 0102]
MEAIIKRGVSVVEAFHNLDLQLDSAMSSWR